MTITADQTPSLSQSAPYSNLVLTGPATTNTLPIKVLGPPQDPINQGLFATAYGVSTSTAMPYVQVLAKWNLHEYSVSQQIGY
jgi:hypothetical protein